MPRLRKFQAEDVRRIVKAGVRALVASAPGTGKTPIAIMSIVYAGPDYFPSLVVCPASVVHNWRREFLRWAPNVEVEIIAGRNTVIQNADVYIVSWALLHDRLQDILSLGINTLVADEAHFAKNPDAQRSEALSALAKKVRGLLLLTGTPIVNDVSEMEVLLDLFDKKPLFIRRTLTEVVPDVPEKVREVIPVKLSPQAQREYDKVENDFAEWLRNRLEQAGMDPADLEDRVERSLAAEAFARITYLRQVVGKGKVPAAVEWISSAVRLGEQVVVFFEHQDVLASLQRGLRKQRIRYVVVEGKTTPKKRQAAIDKFQKREVPVFLASKAGKEGITLHAARHLLFVERWFTAADEEQAEDRVRRIGQVYATKIWRLHAVGTIDDRLDAIVRNKADLVKHSIGSDEIRESKLATTMALIRSWLSFSKPEEKKVSSLGQNEIEPLPRTRDVYRIYFGKERWSPKAALIWCRMNGYSTMMVREEAEDVVVTCNSSVLFRKGYFTKLPISKDIRAIIGKRIPYREERRLLRAKKSRGR